MIDTRAIRVRWEADGSKLDERGQRLFAAAEARAAGWGGKAAVAKITGLALSTVGHGLNELDGPPLPAGQVRQKGGGRRPLTETNETLLDDLRRLVEPLPRLRAAPWQPDQLISGRAPLALTKILHTRGSLAPTW